MDPDVAAVNSEGPDAGAVTRQAPGADASAKAIAESIRLELATAWGEKVGNR